MAENGNSRDIPEDEVDRSIDENELIDDLEPEYYDMSKDRKMIIFNHFQYNDPYPELRNPPKQRHGTESDVAALQKTGELLNYDVTVHDDKTHDEILNIMDQLCAQEHSGTSCVCVCVLTHGWRNGILFARDKSYRLSDLVNKLQDHATGLLGKPKLFFVQACRGELLDDGQHMDGACDVLHVASHMDTLVLRSCVEDYRSFRNGHGSWLIQELCRVLVAQHRRLDLLAMVPIVTKLVAYERKSKNSRRPHLHHKKQTPEFISTFTKTLRFSDPDGF